MLAVAQRHAEPGAQADDVDLARAHAGARRDVAEQDRRAAGGDRPDVALAAGRRVGLQARAAAVALGGIGVVAGRQVQPGLLRLDQEEAADLAKLAAGQLDDGGERRGQVEGGVEEAAGLVQQRGLALALLHLLDELVVLLFQFPSEVGQALFFHCYLLPYALRRPR